MCQHIQNSNTMKTNFIPFSTTNQILCDYLAITKILLEHNAKK